MTRELLKTSAILFLMLLSFFIGAIIPNSVTRQSEIPEDSIRNIKNKIILDCTTDNVLVIDDYKFYCFSAETPRTRHQTLGKKQPIQA